MQTSNSIAQSRTNVSAPANDAISIAFACRADEFDEFLEQTDYEMGRLTNAIAGLGELDITLFVYIAGDNSLLKGAMTAFIR